MNTKLNNIYWIAWVMVMALLVMTGHQKLRAQASPQFTVHWDSIAGKMDSAIWGVADYEIQTIESITDEGYQQFMQKIDPSLVRIHRSSLSTRWTNEETQTWDSSLVIAVFDSAKAAYGDAKIMFNPMPEWPEWMNTGKVLDAAGEDKVISLIAEMAEIVKNNNIDIDYWEVFNERDNDYEDNNALSRYFALYNRAHDTIKSVIPDAIIGGLAFTYPNYTWLTGFLDNCEGNIDFISWHNYSNGPNNKTNDSVLITKRVTALAQNAQNVLNILEDRGLENEIETFLTEYNIQWTWEPIEERHASHVGAIFQASLLNRLAQKNITGVTIWHSKGNAYGLINSKNELRATGVMYSWGTRYFAGQRAFIQNKPSENRLEIIPIINANQNRSVLLMNKTSTPLAIPLNSLNMNGDLRILTLDHNSYYPYPLKNEDGVLHLPGVSATLVTNAPANDTIPPETPILQGFSQLNSVTLNVSNLKDETSFAGFKLFMDNAFHGFYSNFSSIAVSGLKSGETYDFYVVSADEEGNISEQSNTLTLTTKTDTTGPTTPSRFKVEDSGQGEALLQWNPSLDASGILGYVILQNDAPVDTITETEVTIPYSGSGTISFGVFAIDTRGNVSDTAYKELVVAVSGRNYKHKVDIYPNPLKSSALLKIQLNEADEFLDKLVEVQILDITGKPLYSTEFKYNGQTIEVTPENRHMPVGIYYLSIRTSDIYVKKLLIIN